MSVWWDSVCFMKESHVKNIKRFREYRKYPPHSEGKCQIYATLLVQLCDLVSSLDLSMRKHHNRVTNKKYKTFLFSRRSYNWKLKYFNPTNIIYFSLVCLVFLPNFSWIEYCKHLINIIFKRWQTLIGSVILKENNLEKGQFFVSLL